MDNERYLEVFKLERCGKLEAGLSLLRTLAGEDDPLALLELGSRFIATEGRSPPVHPLESDPSKGDELIRRGKQRLEELAAKGDGEAMRMLGYFHLGHLCPCERNIPEAEVQLLRAFQAGCYIAANDLHSFYLGSNVEKAKHYYKQAEAHKCRVVFHEAFET